MDVSIRDSYAFSESTIQEAIAAFQAKQYLSIRATARAFSIPEATLRHRMDGRASRSDSHEYRQILSSAEEKTLLKWITQLTRTGYPASPALGLKMAKTIRRQRYQLSQQPRLYHPISKRWLERFRKRYPEIKGA